MKIEVKGETLLSKEQKDAIANKTVDDLAKHVFDTPKRMKEAEIIKQEELKPQDLPENLDKTFLVSQDLHDLGVILSRLSLRGVDKRIISDTIINNLNYHSVNEICANLDGFLRSKQY